jgi:hypothetical protein
VTPRNKNTDPIVPADTDIVRNLIFDLSNIKYYLNGK